MATGLPRKAEGGSIMKTTLRTMTTGVVARSSGEMDPLNPILLLPSLACLDHWVSIHFLSLYFFFGMVEAYGCFMFYKQYIGKVSKIPLVFESYCEALMCDSFHLNLLHHYHSYQC